LALLIVVEFELDCSDDWAVDSFGRATAINKLNRSERLIECICVMSYRGLMIPFSSEITISTRRFCWRPLLAPWELSNAALETANCLVGAGGFAQAVRPAVPTIPKAEALTERKRDSVWGFINSLRNCGFVVHSTDNLSASSMP
jgi:hypothetical protein